MPASYDPMPVDPDEAGIMINAYRNSGNATSKAMILEMDSTVRVIQDILINYTSRIPLPEPYEWKLAICPIQNRDSIQTVCFLPAIVNMEDQLEVFDFFECREANNEMYRSYFQPLLDRVIEDTGRSFIFDEVKGWP